MISAIKNTDVNGIFITPDKTPAIPTTVKFITFKFVKPDAFKPVAIKKPNNPPINKDGAKMPPLPPDDMVIDVANVFINNTAITVINNTFELLNEKRSIFTNVNFSEFKIDW